MAQKKRRLLTPEEALSLGIERINKPCKGTNRSRYNITPEQWNAVLISRNLGIMEDSYRAQVDPTAVKNMWKEVRDDDGKKMGNLFIKNPLYTEQDKESYKELESTVIENIENYVKENVKPLKVKPQKSKTKYLFDLLVITDIHIGMEPNPNGYSLYGGVWNEEEIFKRLKSIISHTLEEKKSNHLIIIDLGDFLDGWNGKTVRKGHDLPQNMDNEKAYDVAFDFKVSLYSQMAKHYQKVDTIDICDDNHSGSFAYVVNRAVKSFIEQKYKSVKVTIQRKFINHYIFGNKVFVCTHGKDGINLKFGFKSQLDSRQIEKIENYLKEHNLIRSDLDIFFLKGDSHQDIFDNTTAQSFNYWNFPALSPSSNWVQTNFKKGISGFYVINFKKNKYNLNPYYFKWHSN